MPLLNGNTLVPCFGDLFMKACPPQAVLAHSQKAPAIANVFAVGYSVFKEQLENIFIPSLFFIGRFFGFSPKIF